MRRRIKARIRGSRVLWGVAVGVLILGSAGPSNGGVIRASSLALDVTGQISIRPSGGLPAIFNIDPFNQVSAPPDGTNTLIDLSVVGPDAGFAAAVDTVEATTGVNTPQGNAFARASIEDLLMTIILSVAATTIETTAEADETNFVITVTGDTTLGNAGLNIFGNAFALPASPAPNTILFTGLAGVTVVLNEQDVIQTPNVASITVNAIHITFDQAIEPDMTEVNGDIFIARSRAVLALDPALQQPGQPVPEPATLLLLGLGLVGQWFGRRRSRANT